MNKLKAWLGSLAAALLLGWVVPAPCPAQSATAGATTARAGVPGAASAKPAPRRLPSTAPETLAAMAPPPSDAPGAGRGNGRVSELPPSTVSPAIERFMSRGGPTLPPPDPAPPTARTRRLPGAAAPGTPRLTQADPGQAPASRSAPPAAAPPAAGPADSRLVTSGPSPLNVNVTLKTPPLQPTDFRFPINLATALRLSDARPLIIAAAQAGVWQAEAELTRAKVLWVPSVMFGADYIRHDGGGPDFNKGIMTAPSVNYFMAGGGFDLFVNLTDAYFQPLVARQILNQRNWEVQTAKNDALMQTADAYFRVHQYRGIYAGDLYCVELGRELVERIAQLSKELVPTVEVDRARNFLADLEQRALLSRQEWRVQSANLTQVLRLDPRAVVVPIEHDHTQVTLIDPGWSLDSLMPIALTNRPDIASRRAALQAAELGIRREKSRPFLPLVTFGGFQHAGMFLQFGLFGLGPNSSLNQYRGRADESVQLMWQLESFGIGNLARIKGQRASESRAIIELRRAQDAVAAEVNQALARVQSAAARVLQADRALRTGIITFRGHLEGLEQTRRLGGVLVLTFRPQEAVYAIDLLNIAFNEYFSTVADYNRAQFELFHALGYPAGEITMLRTPGDVMPVDTSRPNYLPPVGNGPPPATH